MSYAPGQSGSGTHQVTGEYGADTTHDPSQDSAFVLVDVFLTSPPPPTAVPGSTPVVDPCPPLRKKLKKAKKAGNKPKVRKLKRRLRALGC